jgi:hypothetical protein
MRYSRLCAILVAFSIDLALSSHFAAAGPLRPDHHRNQARAVAALRPKALVFEMLTPGQLARPLGARERSSSTALAEALQWQQSGWPEFSLYWPIFAAAPEARIYAAGIGREDARRAFTQGAHSYFGAEAGLYGLDQPLPADLQAGLEAEQMAAHCQAMPAEMMPAMVEIQRMRDAELARAALRAFRETGGPVAVIAGSGHARTDYGAPAMIRRADPGIRVLALGQIEADAHGPKERRAEELLAHCPLICGSPPRALNARITVCRCGAVEGGEGRARMAQPSSIIATPGRIRIWPLICGVSAYSSGRSITISRPLSRSATQRLTWALALADLARASSAATAAAASASTRCTFSSEPPASTAI